MSMDDDALQPLRQRIDAIDQQLLKLFNERAQCALEGRNKAGQPTEQAPVFYRPEREAQILRRLQGDNVGPLSDQDVAGLFREVISCCLNLSSHSQCLLRAGRDLYGSSCGKAISPTLSLWPRLTKYSVKWSPRRCTTVWCRWRIPLRAW